MRDALACFDCGHGRIYEVEGVRARRFGGDFTLPVARRRAFSDKQPRLTDYPPIDGGGLVQQLAWTVEQVANWRSGGYGQWRAFVCAACTVVEWYVEFFVPNDALATQARHICRRCEGQTTAAWKIPSLIGDKIFEITACRVCGLADWRWLNSPAPTGTSDRPCPACAQVSTVRADVPRLVGQFSVDACWSCGRSRFFARGIERLRADRRAVVRVHDHTAPTGPYR